VTTARYRIVVEVTLGLRRDGRSIPSLSAPQPAPEGSCNHAAPLPSSSSSSNRANHSARVLNGAGGCSSTYPAAAFQNSASTSGCEQSNVRSTHDSIFRR